MKRTTPPDSDDEVVEQLIAEERQKLPPDTFVDFGEPLSPRYDVEQIQLMVQCPFRVFAYWELPKASIGRALQRFPAEDRGDFHILLKWVETGTEFERLIDPGTTSSWWFPAQPDTRYRVEIGLYSEDYGWLPLLTSADVSTPRSALAPPSFEHDIDEQSKASLLLLEECVKWTGIQPQPEIGGQAQPPERRPRIEPEPVPPVSRRVEPIESKTPVAREQPDSTGLDLTVRPTSLV